MERTAFATGSPNVYFRAYDRLKEKLPNNKNIKSKKEILDKVYFFFLDVNGFFKLHTATSRIWWHWSVRPSVRPSVSQSVRHTF